MRRATAAVIAAALWVGAAPAGARGDDIGAAALRRLVRRAPGNARALAHLREVTAVDGRPVDLGAALDGASGERLSARLRALSEATAAPTPRARLDADASRARARAILDQPRFRGPDLPRPLAGALRWIGERVSPILDALSKARAWLVDRLPGGDATFWMIVAGLVAAISVVASVRLGRRRARHAAAGAEGARRGPGDPARLEREADAAEAAGDLERALRLRFRAGLLRLDRLDVLPFDPSATTGAVGDRLASPAFDDVAAGFDEIVYGRRPPGTQDIAAARTGWRRVLEEAARR